MQQERPKIKREIKNPETQLSQESWKFFSGASLHTRDAYSIQGQARSLYIIICNMTVLSAFPLLLSVDNHSDSNVMLTAVFISFKIPTISTIEHFCKNWIFLYFHKDATPHYHQLHGTN